MPTTTETVSAQAPVIVNASKEARRSAGRNLVLRGVRQHNLKNIDLDLPRGKLIVFTGPSGSGKSSLAFDTIYAEGQRRYVESLSSYARQFLERMDKPDADLITGLAPAIAIEQKTLSKNPRSTVATQTEIYDHLRLLFARVGVTYSPVSGEVVTRDTARSTAEALHERLDDGARFYLGVALPGHEGVALKDELSTLHRRGFFRILLLPTERQAKAGKEAQLFDLNETPPDEVNNYARDRLLVLIDRLAVKRGDEDNLTRIADSVEQAFREGRGRCVVKVHGSTESPLAFSEFFERDGIVFEEPIPQLFSFNSPLGACPNCEGFGRVAGIDEDLVIPNPFLSIRQNAVAPFRTPKWSKHYGKLISACIVHGINIDTPYAELDEEARKIVWDGANKYIGINGFFDFLENRSYKMHYRIFRARFRGYTRCPECNGYRLRDEMLYVRVGGLHIGEVAELTTKEAQVFFNEIKLTPHQQEIAGRVLEEIRKRLGYLVEVGLEYLTLDRLSQTLSGGESQRINLSTSLGSSLVGSLYVLDEPSIGLHPRDNDRLINIMENLRDIGNTVLVVEHEAEMMRRADRIVDLGPGAGRHGGEVVFYGDYGEILTDGDSLTGAYLSGGKKIAVPEHRRAVNSDYTVRIIGARQHNLKRVDVDVPLGVITCVTGVSGSGKSTLIHDTLYGGLQRLKGDSYDGAIGKHDDIKGHAQVARVEMVDQDSIGRTTRSNAATYTGAFDGIRALLADTPQARIRGHKPGYFSFNVSGGRCEECQGEGVVQIEMQFLADLYLECEACHGRRYKKGVLEIRYRGKNVHDILGMTVDEAVDFFDDQAKVVNRLSALQGIGLGYLTLGQPSTTLSGGEAQRVKLAEHLGKDPSGHTLYIFDEPTTGLHFADIKKLLSAFNQLVTQGHTVLIVEHNLDVIKCADYVIDLGPEGGHAGGFVVADGTPEEVAGCEESHTGRFLREVL